MKRMKFNEGGFCVVSEFYMFLEPNLVAGPKACLVAMESRADSKAEVRARKATV